MKDRFEGGEDARRRLVTALKSQRIVNGNEDCANELADAVEIKEFKKGDVVIKQDAIDTTIFLVLVGSVDVLVHGRKVAERDAGLDIGAMAMIDVSAKRSATVEASEDSVLGIVTEEQFLSLIHI